MIAILESVEENPWPDEEGFIMYGTLTEGDVVTPWDHRFSKEVLQWRSVEYGIDPSDIRQLFKIIFNEAIHAFILGHFDEAPEQVVPMFMDVSEAAEAKIAMMQAVSSLQNKLLEDSGADIPIDREQLCDTLISLMPEETVQDRDLEDKKLQVETARQVATEVDLMAFQEARILFDEGATDFAEPAIVAGRYMADSRIEGGPTQDELIEQHEADMMSVEELLTAVTEEGRHDEPESGDGGSVGGEHQPGTEGEA